jgi:hypothetical protein
VTPQQWARLKEIFQGALDQPPATRREWVRAAAADDAALVREADALLHAHDTAEGFLEHPIAVSPADFLPDDLLLRSRRSLSARRQARPLRRRTRNRTRRHGRRLPG